MSMALVRCNFMHTYLLMQAKLLLLPLHILSAFLLYHARREPTTSGVYNWKFQVNFDHLDL